MELQEVKKSLEALKRAVDERMLTGEPIKAGDRAGIYASLYDAQAAYSLALEGRIAELEFALKPFTINAHFFEMDDPNYPAYVMVEDPDELLPGDVVIRAEHIQRAAEVLKPNQEFK